MPLVYGANQIAKIAGLVLPLRLERGHILVTEPVFRLGIKLKGEGIVHQEQELSLPPAKHESELEKKHRVRFVFTQTNTGNCLLGRSGDQAPYGAAPSHGAIEALAKLAVWFVPALAAINCIRVFTGQRVYSPDLFLMIGPSGVPGLFLSVGYGDKGISLGGISRLLAQYMVDKNPDIDLKPFWAERFL